MPRSRSLVVALLSLLIFGSNRSHAQSATPATSGVTGTTSSIGRAFAGAVLGGAAGALAGGVAGTAVGSNDCYDRGNPDTCRWLEGLVIGGALGITVGIPVGAHLLNRRHGPLAWSLLASVGIATAGAIAFHQADLHARGAGRGTLLSGILIAVPVLQVVTSTVIEVRGR